MEIVIKAMAACLPAAIIFSALKKDNAAMALLLSLATGVVIFLAVFKKVGEITEFLLEISEAAGISAVVLPTMLKTVGIATITALCADVCKDAGMSAGASAAEFAGAVAALYVSLPVMKMVFQMIEGLIG